MREFIADWRETDPKELVVALFREFRETTLDQKTAALGQVARGSYSELSTCAAAAMCHLMELGDPFDTAAKLYDGPDADVTEPQWFLWIAGYSYNWICNSGLSGCYYEFGDRQFADRIRVYEAIGADVAAQVIREADQAFGPNGPGASLEERQAQTTDEVYARIEELSPRFWACGDEINTRAYLYAKSTLTTSLTSHSTPCGNATVDQNHHSRIGGRHVLMRGGRCSHSSCAG